MALNVRKMHNTPAVGPGWCTFCIKVLKRCTLLRSSDGKIGWKNGTPLCAKSLTHRGFTEGCPVAIRSLTLISREERKDSAQTGTTIITP